MQDLCNAVDSCSKGNCGDCNQSPTDPTAGVLFLSFWLGSHMLRAATPLTVRFAGRRIDLDRDPRPGDSFDREEIVEGLVPGTGPVCVTARIPHVSQGRWSISVLSSEGTDGSFWSGEVTQETRVAMNDAGEPTPWLAQVGRGRGPGVIKPAWLVAVGTAVVAGLTMQLAAVGRSSIGGVAATLVLLSAVAAGYVGAKAWFVVETRRSWRQFGTAGVSVQGYLLAATVTMLLGAWVAGLPIGALLGLSTPGLFVGLGLGRVGCFLSGCCAGGSTNSRWGLWSSDGRIAARRIPTQLLESAGCLLIALASLSVTRAIAPAGWLLGAAWAAYTAMRVLVILPLRDGRPVPVEPARAAEPTSRTHRGLAPHVTELVRIHGL
ncbi:MAG TPA: prolipoprotein diacylglyceryl transferase family protein [Candidatus Polarisedimenticolaceae bacterium]|nr:prolipoprotein diacylglyceryl transferase family protein [Candidatus Polarisedimenticolaceae bacterium]